MKHFIPRHTDRLRTGKSSSALTNGIKKRLGIASGFFVIVLGMALPLLSLLPQPVAAAVAPGYAYTNATCNVISFQVTGVNGNGTRTVTINETNATSNEFKGNYGIGGGRAIEVVNVDIKTGSKCAATGTITSNGGAAEPISIIVPGGTPGGGGGTPTNNVGTWIDHSDFSFVDPSGATLIFHDGQIDNNLDFSATAPGCNGDVDEVNGFPNGNGYDEGNATATVNLTLWLPSGNANDAGCTKASETIGFTNAGAFDLYFKWVDAGTIETSDGTAMIFSQDATTATNYLDSGGNESDSSCKSQMAVTAVGATTGTITLWTSGGSVGFNSGWPDVIRNANYTTDGNCKHTGGITAGIADPIQPDGTKASALAAGSAGTAGASAGSGTEPTFNCSLSLNPLSWVMCPIASAFVDLADSLDNQINQQLCVPADLSDTQGADNGSCSGGAVATSQVGQIAQFKSAWATIRVLALGLIVVIGLIAVISQAGGFQALDAYTIKKAMPRLIIAAIGISLSWALLNWFIQLTNDLGFGVRALIYSTVNTPDLKVNLGGGTQTLGVFFGAGFAIFGLGIMGLLSFAATAALATAVAFLVLVLRQMIIIALLIFSPLAILCYILPNTQKVWKLWWESFSRGLLMFPIIAGLIALGHVFAAYGTQKGSNAVAQLLAFTAYFAPYFMIPFTFRLAGGAISTIGGLVNDRSRGAFDGLKGYRKNKGKSTRAARKERALGNKFFKGAGETGFRASANKRIQQAAHLNRIADKGLTGGFKGNIGAAIQAREAAEKKHIMDDETFNTWAAYDDVSGMAADVLMGNEYGIRKRLMKTGVGVKRNKDGSIYRNAEGEMELSDDQAERDKLNNTVGSMMESIHKGDRQSALRTGLTSAGAFKRTRIGANGEQEEYTDEAELETNVSHIMAATRKYGDEPLTQALVKKAAAGGTYYDNASDVWYAANKAVGHDGAARSEMAGTLRGTLINAGRGDQGGGSFGTTIGFMADLGNAQAVAEQRAATSGRSVAVELQDHMRELQTGYTAHVLGNNPAGTLFHASMKENYVEQNLVPVMRSQLKTAEAAAHGKGQDSPEFAEYMKAIATASNIHQQTLATKPALAAKIGDSVMAMELPTGRMVADSTGAIVPEKMEVRALEQLYKQNPIYQRYHQEWLAANERNMTEAQQAAAQQALNAAGQSGAPGSGPQTPVGGAGAQPPVGGR